MFLLFILGDDAVAWKVLVMVVSIILTAACATFLIAIFTLMCWRKHKCKFLTGNQQVCVHFYYIYVVWIINKQLPPGTAEYTTKYSLTALF